VVLQRHVPGPGEEGERHIEAHGGTGLLKIDPAGVRAMEVEHEANRSGSGGLMEERGRRGYDQNRYEFNKLIWNIASPKWKFDDATYDRSAASFNNPDHVAIVIDNYRWRLSLSNGEPRYDDLEQKLAKAPLITVPTMTIASDFDGSAADGAAYAKRFVGRYEHRILKGIGHNVPQEAPAAFAQAIVDVDRF